MFRLATSLTTFIFISQMAAAAVIEVPQSVLSGLVPTSVRTADRFFKLKYQNATPEGYEYKSAPGLELGFGREFQGSESHQLFFSGTGRVLGLQSSSLGSSVTNKEEALVLQLVLGLEGHLNLFLDGDIAPYVGAYAVPSLLMLTRSSQSEAESRTFTPLEFQVGANIRPTLFGWENHRWSLDLSYIRSAENRQKAFDYSFWQFGLRAWL